MAAHQSAARVCMSFFRHCRAGATAAPRLQREESAQGDGGGPAVHGGLPTLPSAGALHGASPPAVPLPSLPPSPISPRTTSASRQPAPTLIGAACCLSSRSAGSTRYFVAVYRSTIN